MIVRSVPLLQSVTDEDIARLMPRTTAEQRVTAFNTLLSSSRIQLVGNDYDNPRYRALAAEEAAKVKGLGVEDLLVYQVISQAGNTGIWTRDMRQRTNLPQGKINKTLKVLEERNLVKAVKSVQNASRKVYMLAILQPAKEITGGPWYGADQQPDRAFIDAMRTVAAEFVGKHGPVSVTEVAEFIARSGVSNQPLQEEDISNILRTLCYDMELERIEVTHNGLSVDKFRVSKLTPPKMTAFTDIPCGVCPVFDDCHEGGPVSPENCQYYAKWLGELDF